MWEDLSSSSAAKTAPKMKQKMSKQIILSTSAIFQSGFHQQEVCVSIEFADILNIVIANSLLN